MCKSNIDTKLYFLPKKSVKWDYILLFTTFVPFMAIGFPFFFIFETYPDIVLLFKIIIIISSIILTFLLIFFGLCFGPPVINEAIITNESITRKKFWLNTTIFWNEITKMDETIQFGLQRSFGKRFFTIYSRKKWITFSDKITDYEKFKEIILDKAGAKYFKHDENRFGETWVK